MRSEDAAHNDVSRQNESSRLLDGLNPEQIEAVTTTKGYIRVIAGAGTGKTKVLTRRLAYLIEPHFQRNFHFFLISAMVKQLNIVAYLMRSAILGRSGKPCLFSV